ncbi:hypothetical protein D3C72_1634180 [compost metagenome]
MRAKPKAIASAIASIQNNGQWPRAAANHSQSPLRAPCATGTSAVLIAAAHSSSRAACAGRRRAAHSAHAAQVMKQAQRMPWSTWAGATRSSTSAATKATEIATHRPMQTPTVARAMLTAARDCCG